MTIPKIIYYVWFGEDKPQKVIDCINNWKEKLTNYQIVEINDKNKELFDVEKECQNNLWFKICYENKMWAYIADYARLKVLYANGGVYFDTDVIVEKDITNLVEKNKLILGWENDDIINFAVACVPKQNSIVKEIFDFYNKEIWNSALYTIPQITTYIIKKHNKLNLFSEVTENNDILILPPEYFYPLPMGLSEKEEYVTKNTYTVHLWNASWTKTNVHYFLRNKHKKELNKLINKCFCKKCIFKNYFLTIEKLCDTVSINIDFSYLLRFKYKYYKHNKMLTIIILGIQIPLIIVRKMK